MTYTITRILNTKYRAEIDAMTSMERAALNHAAEWLRYSRSARALLDADRDRRRRATADAAAGHSPNCTLVKCFPPCPKANRPD